MKFFFVSLLCICFALPTFAQTTPEELAVKIADMLAEGSCDCFNEHVVGKLSPAVHKSLDKLVARNVTTKAEAQRVLTMRELMAMNQELQPLMPEEGDFADCASDLGMGMMQFHGAITELTNAGKITEDQLDAQVDAQVLPSMKKLEKCKVAYYLYMISKSDK